MPFHIVAVMTFTYLLAIFLLLAIALGYLSRFRRSRTEPRINDSEDSEEAIDVKSRKVGKPKPGFKTGQKYHMTMGLRKSDPKEWLQIDSEYLAVHKIKSVLLDENKSQVLQCLRGSEAACREVLDLVVEFLTRSFPKEFISWVPAPGIQYVMITKTQEIFKVSPPYDELGSLEIAARLAMEDFNIMIKGENDVHTLIASVTTFPVGWSVKDRVGWSLAELHRAVPMWQEKIGSLVERFFSRMTPTTTMERWNFFVQVTEPSQSLSDILCQLKPMDTIASKPEDILIRWERQTFRRLPKSGAILFSVKTDLVRFIDLNAESLRDFAIETRSWPEEVANYKRRNGWGECALQYCDSMQKNQDKTDNECID